MHQRVEIVRGDLFDVMLTGDLNPTLRAELPGALTSARKGDSAPLIRLVARSAGIISFASSRRPATTSPTPSSPRRSARRATSRGTARRALTGRAQQINAAATGCRARRAFNPFDIATALTTEMVSLCLGWPSTTGGYVPAGPLPDVPTLVIDGAADVRTPLEDAAAGQVAHPVRAAARGPLHRPLDARERPVERAVRRARRAAVLHRRGSSRRARRATTRSPPPRSRRRSSAACEATGPRRQGRPHDHRRARDRPGHAPPDHRRRARGRAAAVARRRPARRARRRAQRDPHALQRRLRAGRQGVGQRAAQRRPPAADDQRLEGRQGQDHGHVVDDHRPPRRPQGQPRRPGRRPRARARVDADYRQLLRRFKLRHAG